MGVKWRHQLVKSNLFEMLTTQSATQLVTQLATRSPGKSPDKFACCFQCCVEIWRSAFSRGPTEARATAM